MIALLTHPIYGRLFTAQVTALTGTGISTVALALLAYEIAGADAGQVLGIALALKMIAYVTIAPAVGGIAHRLPRKVILVGLDLVRAGIVVLLPFVTGVWQVYALIFALSAAAAGFTPTFQAAVPDVLTDEKDYTRALALTQVAYNLENLLSPTLAGLALLVMSFDNLFFLNGVTFLVSAALVVSVSLPRMAPSDRDGGFLANATYGIRGYLRTPRLRGLLLFLFAYAQSGAMVIVNTVVIVQGALGGSEQATALMLAAAGAGAMLGAMAVPKLVDRVPIRTVLGAGAALILPSLLLASTGPGYAGLLPLWLLLGLGGALVNTPAGRLVQMSCAPEDRPSFYAAQFALSHAAWLVAYPLVGFLGGVAGLGPTFLILAALVALASLGALSAWRSEQSLELTHRHDAIEHDHLHVHDAHHDHAHEGWKGTEPHRHPHRHEALTHAHAFVIDRHHPRWPRDGD